jgi:uncharacterized damage-inducible protein DinB
MDERDIEALERMTAPETKSELLARIASARDALNDAVAALTEDELADLRDGAGWSTADHLSHIAAWERMIVAHLTDGSDHEIVGIDCERYDAATLDELNNLLTTRCAAWLLATRWRSTPRLTPRSSRSCGRSTKRRSRKRTGAMIPPAGA